MYRRTSSWRWIEFCIRGRIFKTDDQKADFGESFIFPPKGSVWKIFSFQHSNKKRILKNKYYVLLLIFRTTLWGVVFQLTCWGQCFLYLLKPRQRYFHWYRRNFRVLQTGHDQGTSQDRKPRVYAHGITIINALALAKDHIATLSLILFITISTEKWFRKTRAFLSF
jgi:hypothetical protein